MNVMDSEPSRSICARAAGKGIRIGLRSMFEILAAMIEAGRDRDAGGLGPPGGGNVRRLELA
jgi:hypothetical protein